MSTAIAGLILLLLAGLALAAARVSLPVATAVLGAGLLLLDALADGVRGLWLAWLPLLAWNLTPLRLRLLAPLPDHVRRAQPPMSDTEREALAAGTVWWEAELFAGDPHWQRLLSLPAPALSAEEQAFLDGPTTALCAQIDDWRITHVDRDLPPALWQTIRTQGFLGMIVPRAYGGLGFSAQAHSAVVTRIASRSVSVAVTVMVPNSLGPAELLLAYGTQAQKDHWLPRLARGEDIPCFALTGPEAGSDAASIPDRGVVCRGLHAGRETLGIRVSWDTRYITLAPVATVLGLAFRLHDPDGLLGDRADIGITLALIPTTHPGVEIGRRHFPGNQAFMNGPTRGRDVFIPLDWIIGGPACAGHGWTMLMECLAAGRGISLPANGTAGALYAARVSGAYARVRRQFKLPIGRFEGVAEALARIGGHAYVLEAARRLSTLALDLGEKPAVVSAIVKYQSTERMRAAVNDAMDIHGGKGICHGPSNWLAGVYQALPIGITVEGANILTRTLIVFGQGALRCHPWLRSELAAAGNPDRRAALAAFDQAFRGHLGHLLGTLARAGGRALSAAAFAPAPAGADAATRHWYRELSRLSAAFALVADVALLTLGGELKRRERLCGRLADALAELYLASAALKRYEDDGRPEADLACLDYVLAEACYAIEKRLSDALANFPRPLLGSLLRRLVFPWGRRMRGARDAQSARVAELMMSPGPARERLSGPIHVSRDPAEAVGALELAFEAVVAAEAIEARLQAAKRRGRLQTPDPAAALAAGELTAGEFAQLEQAAALVRRVIAVDDFDPAALAGHGVATVATGPELPPPPSGPEIPESTPPERPAEPSPPEAPEPPATPEVPPPPSGPEIPPSAPEPAGLRPAAFAGARA